MTFLRLAENFGDEVLRLAENFGDAKSIVIKGSLFVVMTSSVNARKRVPYKH